MHVLLAEEDRVAAEYVRQGLTEAGHVVDVAGDGESGLTLALAGGFDVLVVDRMLPRRDGPDPHAACGRHPHLVLVLSALGQVDQRVEGLRAGGDDYLVKPFAFFELLARIETLGGAGKWARRGCRVCSGWPICSSTWNGGGSPGTVG